MNRREFMKTLAVVSGGIGVRGSLAAPVPKNHNGALMDEKAAGRRLSREASFYRKNVCLRRACEWVDWKKHLAWELKCPFAYGYNYEGGVLLCRAENTQSQPMRKWLERTPTLAGGIVWEDQ